VRDVTDGGECVVETERGIVMVHGALPGERVRVRMTDKRGGVARGTLLTVLAPSPERVVPTCSIVDRCGGCPLMSLELNAQRALKLQHVERALTKVRDEGLNVELEAGASALGYRRRARFAFRTKGGAALGYHAHASQQLIDLERCPVLEPALEAALTSVRAELLPSLAGSGEIELSSLDAEHVSVSVSCGANLAPDAYRAAEALAQRAPVVSVSLRIGELVPARFGTPPALLRASDGLPLAAPLHGFAQVNAGVNALLGRRVVELAEAAGARVLELYAGHGNFTIALAAQASELLAVEGDAAAADACRENLRSRGCKHASVRASDVGQLQLKGRFDVIVLDPPRAGCAKLAALASAARPERIVYVSCHMTTLSRDLQALHALGYRADRALALDMFPQTGHVEAVVRMRRRASS
jgi:23S rRNA (uracil1939-C5)-methyltransferase